MPRPASPAPRRTRARPTLLDGRRHVENRPAGFPSPADGLAIATYQWDDVMGGPVGIIQLVHGLAEHGPRYDRFARALNAAGFVVSAADNRGHGASVSKDVPLGSFGAAGVEGFVADIGAHARLLASQHPDVPLFASAHSLGSMGMQIALLAEPVRYGGVVLSGSTTLDGLGGVLAGLPADQPGLATFNAGFEPRTGFEWLSRDPAEVDAYVADPLCGFPTEDAIIGGVLGQAERTVEPSQIRPDLPLLLISGDRDPVGGPGGSNVMALADRYRSAGITDVTATLYPDAGTSWSMRPPATRSPPTSSAGSGRTCRAEQPDCRLLDVASHCVSRSRAARDESLKACPIPFS